MSRSLVALVCLCGAALSFSGCTRDSGESSALSTGVIEEGDMRRVLRETDDATLVVFDIDNTLIAPEGYEGSDERFDWLYASAIAAGVPKPVALKRADDTFNREQYGVRVHSVDPSTPAVFAELRARRVPFFALTARSTPVRRITVEQLMSVGLGMDELPRAWADSSGIPCQSGVFFNGEGGDTKGESLLKIINASGLKIRRVVFVDDKLRNVKDVDTSLTAAGIRHLCVRFSRKDAEIARFHAEMESGLPTR